MTDASARARLATTYCVSNNRSGTNSWVGRKAVPERLTLVVAEHILIKPWVPPALDMKSSEVSSLLHSFVVVGGLAGGVSPWCVSAALPTRRGILSNGVHKTGARKDIVCIHPSHHLVLGYIQNGRLVCGAIFLHRMQLKHAPSSKNDYSRDIRTPF